MLGTQLISGAPGYVVSPRTVLLTAEAIVGTSKGEDWKERDQNKSQELHFDSRERVVRKSKSMRGGGGERKEKGQESGSARPSWLNLYAIISCGCQYRFLAIERLRLTGDCSPSERRPHCKRGREPRRSAAKNQVSVPGHLENVEVKHS